MHKQANGSTQMNPICIISIQCNLSRGSGLWGVGNDGLSRCPDLARDVLLLFPKDASRHGYRSTKRRPRSLTSQPMPNNTTHQHLTRTVDTTLRPPTFKNGFLLPPFGGCGRGTPAAPMVRRPALNYLALSERTRRNHHSLHRKPPQTHERLSL